MKYKLNLKFNSFILVLIILIGYDVVESSTISSSLYNGYALIGSNSNARISFATLLEKTNRSLPYSNNNPYELKHVFSDQTKLYGSKVALGQTDKGTINVTLGAITSPNENMVYLYDFEECTKSTCDPIIEFSTDGSSSDSSDSSSSSGSKKQLEKKHKIKCDIGEVSLGDSYFVTQCTNNLLNSKTNASAIAICFLDLDKTPNDCIDVVTWGDSNQILPLSNNTCLKGQLYVTSIDTHHDKIIISACGVCMGPDANQIKVNYISGFVVLQVDYKNLTAYPIEFEVSNRNESCPSSVAMSNDWVVMGYPEENVVDLYFLNSSALGFTYFGTIKEADTNSFGSIVNLGDHLLVVTDQGNPSQDQYSRTYFYEIYNDVNASQTGIEASIPNLNYKTPYEYGYSTSFYGEELLVLSQDITLTKMAFTFYGVCPAGEEWNSDFKNCSLCPPGQYKYVSNDSIGSFELCYPCPKGYYTGNKTGIPSMKDCKVNSCSPLEFCPDGSVYPLPTVPIESYSQSNPDPNNSEELDFESTFYNSCYPYFLLILGGTLLLSLGICLPWPCAKYHKVQTNIIKGLLKVNFYDWDGETMTEEIEYLEPNLNSSMAIQINTLRSSKRGIFVKKRRTAVKPVKAVESFCSYYFLIVFVLMCIFIFQFQHVNNDETLELRPLGQASTSPDPGSDLSDAQYLKIIDSSPMKITIDLLGYSGSCNQSEFSIQAQGCQKPNYMGTCPYVLSSILLSRNSSNPPYSGRHCRIQLDIPLGVEYAVDSTFTFLISPTYSYFYTQRIIYNVSTNNDNNNVNNGNSFVTGVIQPDEGTILRPTASISILSMLTLISDCKIKSADSGMGLSLIRPMIEKCSYNPTSFKDLSQISNSSSYLRSADYHDADPNFSFTIHIDKSIFYHYATSSHSVSFGEIVTVILFAVLDVFWVIEVIVPLIQYIVAIFDEYFKKKKKDQKNDDHDEKDEMDNLLDSSRLSKSYNNLNLESNIHSNSVYYKTIK